MFEERIFARFFGLWRAGDCEAYFFAVRKNMWRQAWRTSVRSRRPFFVEKCRVTPDTFLIKIWARLFLTTSVVRRPNEVARGEFWSWRPKEGSPSAPCNGAFFFGTAKKGESVTFVKVTKHLP